MFFTSVWHPNKKFWPHKRLAKQVSKMILKWRRTAPHLTKTTTILNDELRLGLSFWGGFSPIFLNTSLHPGSQPPLKNGGSFWMMINPYYKKWWFVNQPIKMVVWLPGYRYHVGHVRWFHVRFSRHPCADLLVTVIKEPLTWHWVWRTTAGNVVRTSCGCDPRIKNI